MRNFYEEFFCVSKNEKISEKVMITRVITTVAVIVFCLAAMGITAYAYFSCSITSGNNRIQVANFETNVDINIMTHNGQAVKVVHSNKKHEAELKDGVYYVSIVPTERSTAKTGFVVITAEGCATRYHTHQLGTDGDNVREEITFTLSVSADTKVTFIDHWGTSSYYDYSRDSIEKYIKQGAFVNMVISSTSNSGDQDENDTTDTVIPDAPETETPDIGTTQPVPTPPDEEDTTNTDTTDTEDTTTEDPTEVVYEVVSGDNLTWIAERYNVNLERLIAYNQIENPNLIEVGQKIKIPPADWQMPETTVTIEQQ